MDLSNTPTPTPTPTIRHDGWTPARRLQFLERLAQDGNVLAACALVGLSREAAYQLRRRDPLFARAWAAAQALAREASAEVLASRAIDGVEEEVWHGGAMVGTRIRYDTRLLLAHMARLDKLAEANPRAEADAGRFDELLARVAGVELPAELTGTDGDLPPTRLAHVKAACDEADRVAQAAFDALDTERLEAGQRYIEDDDPEWNALEEEAARAWELAYHGAVAEWDGWFGEACATVDRLRAEPLRPAPDAEPTLSGLSSSPVGSEP